MWKVFKNQSQNNLTEQIKGLENTDFTHFPVQMSVTRTPYRQCCILREYNEFTAISRGIKQYKQILETEKMQF